MMDYRELENRLYRNREIRREREHDRLVELALQHNPPRRQREGLRVLSFGLVKRLFDALKQIGRHQPVVSHRPSRPRFEHR